MTYYTDKELLDRFQFYLVQVEDLLLKGEDFKTVGEQIPIALQVNDLNTSQIIKINNRCTYYTGFTLDEIKKQGEKYFQIIHPRTVKNIMKYVPEFYHTQDSSQTLPFVQYVKLFRENEYKPVISFTKPTALPSGNVLWISALPDELGKLSGYMEQAIEMDQFKLKHFKRFQQLTKQEVTVLKMLANGFNNPQIAEKLFIARKTVETHRKHLKRKLGLRSFRDIMKYAYSFNLVNVRKA